MRVIPSQFGANPTAVARLIETTFDVKTTKVAAEKVTTHLVSGNVLLWVPKQDLEKIDKLSIKAEDHSFKLEVRGMAKPPAPKRTPLTDEERAEKRREKNRRRAERRKALKEKTKETKEAAATLDSDSSPITPGPEGMDQDIPQPTASETPAAPLTAEPAGTKNPVRLTQADLNDLSPLPAITASREEENLFLSSIPSSMATALSTLTAEDLRSASTLPAALSAAPTPAASQANRKREWQFSPTSPGASPDQGPPPPFSAISTFSIRRDDGSLSHGLSQRPGHPLFSPCPWEECGWQRLTSAAWAARRRELPSSGGAAKCPWM